MIMNRLLLTALMPVLLAGPVGARQTEPPAPLAVGTEAPDFTLISADRNGTGELMSLRDFRGQVVVIAFFYRARSSG